ncbi:MULTISPECIES: RDD family protein [unclassified Cupriavidus]|uniref:RDD family protein n=1 Tax=unclassified Cupriavidus TaxID=2640874 RepID=UPI001C0005E7|nr:MULTISPECIES: RDD family protein [unclassified Cupriavidus]MCA3185632.1 RDD family protein [Cupriavidus sp.]MCA3191404.1 RDD family protein [Cupriavidus sp.]MCA3196566.1 RDD family protein [Cupriavidus sp.]MCA3203146.1 RDD family protein [Cupriavidus sp.]MCA3209879.1 RDD family protein [Cupriavidus sp.]
MPVATPAASAQIPPTPRRTPTLRRRLLCMLYEGVLLFGVLMAASAVSVLARPLLQQLGLNHFYVDQVWMFIVLGAYFSWFWQRNGQTLAMQTWRIRLETTAGQPPRWGQALLRYVLAWLWLPPAAAVGHAMGLTLWPFVGVLAVGLLIWMSLAWLDPRRQFLHDRLAGTRLTDLRPQP